MPNSICFVINPQFSYCNSNKPGLHPMFLWIYHLAGDEPPFSCFDFPTFPTFRKKNLSIFAPCLVDHWRTWRTCYSTERWVSCRVFQWSFAARPSVPVRRWRPRRSWRWISCRCRAARSDAEWFFGTENIGANQPTKNGEHNFVGDFSWDSSNKKGRKRQMPK